MERQKKVIDASVGFKWFSNEGGFEKARAMLNLHTEDKMLLVVPELFFYEITNALRYKKAMLDKIKLVIKELYAFQLHSESLSLPLLVRASEISIESNLTIYDATYIALAEKLNAKLVTADQKIIDSKHPLVEVLA